MREVRSGRPQRYYDVQPDLPIQIALTRGVDGKRSAGLTFPARAQENLDPLGGQIVVTDYEGGSVVELSLTASSASGLERLLSSTVRVTINDARYLSVAKPEKSLEEMQKDISYDGATRVRFGWVYSDEVDYRVLDDLRTRGKAGNIVSIQDISPKQAA